MLETIQKVLDKKFTKSRGKKWLHKDLETSRTEVRTYLLKKSGEGHRGNGAKGKGKLEAKDAASDDDASGAEGPINPPEPTDTANEVPIKPKSVENKDTYSPPSTSLQQHYNSNTITASAALTTSAAPAAATSLPAPLAAPAMDVVSTPPPNDQKEGKQMTPEQKVCHALSPTELERRRLILIDHPDYEF